MAVELKSGASTDLQTIDPVSKAGRVTLYNQAGEPLSRNITFEGSAEIEVRQSAATGAPVVVWALHNPDPTKIIFVQSIQVRCFFDGTAAATLMKYEIIKATGVTVFSGGVLVTPLKKKTSQTPLGVVRLLDTGLTTTGIANVQVLGNLVQGRVTQTTTNFSSSQELFDFWALQKGAIQLAQNEILGIRQTVTSVVGDNIIGTVDWNEAT